MREHAHLQHFELLLDSSFICVHEAGQFRQADGGVQLEELLQHRQLALLVHKGHEAPELLPVCLLNNKAAHKYMAQINNLCVLTPTPIRMLTGRK